MTITSSDTSLTAGGGGYADAMCPSTKPFLLIELKYFKNSLQSSLLYVCLSVYLCICVEKRNQLDVTACFIALMITSTCFEHFYAHHQELETIRVLLPPTVCSAWLLVVGGQLQAAGCESRKRDAAAC